MSLGSFVLKCVIAVVALAAGAGGTAVSKDNKHNKEKKQWQDEKCRLQKHIEDCQRQIVEKQEKIVELQKKLRDKEAKILELTKEQHVCNQMIDRLEQKQSELESWLRVIIAFITFRYSAFQCERVEVKNELNSNRLNKNRLVGLVENAGGECTDLETVIFEVEQEVKYLESEKNEKEGTLNSIVREMA